MNSHEKKTIIPAFPLHRISMPDSVRFRAIVEYEGTAYHGWQSQPDLGLPTIQASLEKALSQVCNHPVSVIAAGRTDRGVHASGQTIHFDVYTTRDARALLRGANTLLPHDISLLFVEQTNKQFHARFSAIGRRYQYYIYEHTVPRALFDRFATFSYYPLHAEKMHRAAQSLIGAHDFKAFQGAGCQAKSSCKTITHLSVKRMDTHLICLDIAADGFLLHMVRNIMGVLLPIGRGEKNREWAETVLFSKNRNMGHVTAPPQGLYFIEALYPEEKKQTFYPLLAQ